MDGNIFVILDGSGSMISSKDDVVKGVNTLITEQQADSLATGDQILFSLITFDGKVMEVYLQEDIHLVDPVTTTDTFLGGGTALLDAIGRTLAKAEIENAPGRNLVVIYTDGVENASVEFTHEKIEKLIQKLEKANWQFMYLGAEFANFHKERVAVASGMSMNTRKGAAGTSATFANVSSTYSYSRTLSNADLATAAAAPGGLVATTDAIGVTDWHEAIKGKVIIKDKKNAKPDKTPIS